MVGDKAPFTYQKNFEFIVNLRISSQHPMDGVTLDTVMDQIRVNLTHSDTITDVSVVRVEQAPSRLRVLIERLAVLQNVLGELKEEIKGCGR